MALSTRSVASKSAPSSVSVTVDRPAGTVVGDLLLAAITGSTARTFTPPSGWTRLTSGDTDRTAFFWRRAGASEPSSYTFSGGVGSGSNHGIIACLVEAADPADAVSFERTSTVVASQTVTGVTAAAVGLLVSFWVNTAAGRTVSTPPAGMTQRHFDNVDGTRAFYDESIAAGATGSRSITWNNSGILSGALLAIEPQNTAPNAPVLTAPIGGATVDRTADFDLEGTFSDPDAGDQLSAYEVEYRLQAGGGLVQPGEISASGTTFAYTITGGTLSAGGWEWRARTRDAAGALGDWSGWEQFTAASPPAAPVITDPADAGTVNTDPYTVAWTSPAQDAYQVRTVADAAGSPDTGIVYEDTGTVVSTSARSASIDFATNGRTEHVQIRVRLGGLWSAWDSHIVSVSYTVPPTPTVVVTPVNGTDTAGGYISVAISNPTPGGSEPAITGNDLRRQQSSDGGTTWTDEALIPDLFNRVAAGVVEDGTYEDYLVGDERRWIYRYQAVALGDNGTRAAGAWTT